MNKSGQHRPGCFDLKFITTRRYVIRHFGSAIQHLVDCQIRGSGNRSGEEPLVSSTRIVGNFFNEGSAVIDQNAFRPFWLHDSVFGKSRLKISSASSASSARTSNSMSPRTGKLRISETPSVRNIDSIPAALSVIFAKSASSLLPYVRTTTNSVSSS